MNQRIEDRNSLTDPVNMRASFLEGKLFATHYAYSDVNPYEVLKVISDNCLEIREMNHEVDQKDPPQFTPGGFSAHCHHFGSRVISVDPNGRVYRIRRKKKDPTRWGYKSMRFALDKEPHAYYDYNF